MHACILEYNSRVGDIKLETSYSYLNLQTTQQFSELYKQV